MMQTQISPETHSQYLGIYNRLLAAAIDDPETGQGDTPPLRIANLMANRWPEWSKGTQTLYRAAIIHAFRTHTPAPDAVLALVTDLKCNGEKGQNALDRKTGIPPVIRQELINRARQSWSSVGALTAEWIRAGTLTGLRPAEWEDATFLDRHEDIDGTLMVPALRVVTAKRREGDNRKVVRYLGLNNFNDHDIAAIQIFQGLLSVHSASGSKELVRKVSRLVSEISDRIEGGKGVTLYSTRHQFAANAKSVNRLVAVGALMGHISMVDTPSRYASAAISEIGVEYGEGVWTVSAVPFPDFESLREMEAVKAGKESWFAEPKGRDQDMEIEL